MESSNSRLLEGSNVFIDAFRGDVSVDFGFQSFCTVHYISAIQNIGCFQPGKCSTSSVLMASV